MIITTASIPFLYHHCSDQDSCTNAECCTKPLLSVFNDLELQISYSLAVLSQKQY